MGSTSDEPHAKKITDKLDEYGIAWEQHAASAHKQPLKVLEILTANKDGKDIVYITIAGRSNALSGFVADAACCSQAIPYSSSLSVIFFAWGSSEIEPMIMTAFIRLPLNFH